MLLEVPVGRDEVWGWLSPAPLAAATTPTLEIWSSADRWTPTLSAQRAPVTVSALDTDKDTLTATAAIAAADRTAGEDGEAWLICADGQVLEVRIGRIVGSTLHLATPLPRPVVIDADNHATVQWRRWAATLEAEEPDETPGPTAEVDHLAWRIAYQERTPGGGASSRLDEGVLQIVARRFWTGLTLAELRRRVLEAVYREGRHGSLQGLVDDALEELIADIESQLPRERDVSTVPNGRDFVGPHAGLVRARLPKTDLETRQSARKNAQAWTAKLMARVLSANANGTPNTPPRSRRKHLLFGGGGFPTAERRFKRGMNR